MRLVPFLISQYRTILISILFILLSFAFPLSQSHAQSNYYPNSSYLQPETNPDVPQNLHTMTQSLFIDILSTGYCFLVGVDPVTENHKCLGIDPNTKKLGYVSNQKQGGLLGYMTGAIASTYTYPLYTARTMDYFLYLAGNFRGTGASKAYAQGQGVGFQGVSVFIPIWAAIRNAVYLILVVVFVFIGLGIMLRIKIDPRTVMTLQNQIPKIIAGLLLVTLSFAIAGFLIDMMYVITLLFLNILHSADTTIQITPDKLVQYPHPFGAVNDLVSGGILRVTANMTDAVIAVIQNAFGPLFAIIQVVMGLICATFGVIVGFTLLGPIGAIIGGAAGGFGCPFEIPKLILDIIFLIAMLVALFRFWIALITSYITVLINTILGPLFIILGVVPGVGAGFGQWMRDMIANLAVFPITLSFIYILGLIINIASNGNTTNIFTPPMVPGTSNGQGIAAVVGFVGILMLPDLVKTVKGALKSKDFFNIQPHLGAGGAVAAAAGGAAMLKLFGRADPLKHQREGVVRRVLLGGATNPRRLLFNRLTGSVTPPPGYT